MRACVCVASANGAGLFLAVRLASQRASSERRMMRETEEMKVKRSESCKK